MAWRRGWGLNEGTDRQKGLDSVAFRAAACGFSRDGGLSERLVHVCASRTLRAMNRLADAQVTNSRFAFLSSPR